MQGAGCRGRDEVVREGEAEVGVEAIGWGKGGCVGWGQGGVGGRGKSVMA